MRSTSRTCTAMKPEPPVRSTRVILLCITESAVEGGYSLPEQTSWLYVVRPTAKASQHEQRPRLSNMNDISDRTYLSPMAKCCPFLTVSARKGWHFETVHTRIPCIFGRLPIFQQVSICQLEYFHTERATAVEHVVAGEIFAPAPGRKIASGTS